MSRMDLSPNLQIAQKAALTPYLQHYLHLLQMCQYDLKQYIDAQLTENPVLETVESDASDLDDEKRRELLAELTWLDKDAVKDQKLPALGEVTVAVNVAVENNLYQYLLLQLQCLQINQTDYQIGEYIINFLNSAGYLEAAIGDLSQNLGFSEAKVANVLKLIQQMDPPGVGARSLQECLTIQLQRKHDTDPILLKLVANHLEELGQRKFGVVAKKLHISLAALQDYWDIIRSLEPRPGSGFNPNERCDYIVPDFIVVKTAEGFEVSLNNSRLPRLRISSYYRDLLADKQNRQLLKYVKTKVSQAETVIKSITDRNDTLLAIVRSLVRFQQNFFRHGPGHLTSLTLKTIAEELGINPSTVSRAIHEKYLQCRWGTFAVKYFFASAFNCSPDTEAPATAKTIKLLIKKLIANEDKTRPYSDQKIVELLAAEDLTVARRTVAKYREALQIAPAAQRKEL
jgi:RNA polymerase sigma-54 factor